MTALLLACMFTATATDPTVLVLRSGQALTVRSYAIAGSTATVIDAKGQALVLRADLIDVEATTRHTARARARAAADREAEAAAMAAARASQDESRRRNAEHLARSTGVGAVNITDDGPQSLPAEWAPSTLSATEGCPNEAPDDGGWAGRVAKLRSDYRAAVRANAAASAEHNKVEALRSKVEALRSKVEALHSKVEASHNDSRLTVEREVTSHQVASYRLAMAETRRTMERLQAEWATLERQARRANVPAVVYRGGISD